MGYKTNHLKTGPSNLNISLSSASGNKIDGFARNQSLNV